MSEGLQIRVVKETVYFYIILHTSPRHDPGPSSHHDPLHAFPSPRR